MSVKDPVCGMDVDPERSEHHLSLKAKNYHFCSAGCLEKFTKSPDQYLNKKQTPASPAAAVDAVYTCPMHPEIEQIGPGSCPICGMALEPKDATSADEDTTELDDMTRRFWLSTALALPVLNQDLANLNPKVIRFIESL